MFNEKRIVSLPEGRYVWDGINAPKEVSDESEVDSLEVCVSCDCSGCKEMQKTYPYYVLVSNVDEKKEVEVFYMHDGESVKTFIVSKINDLDSFIEDLAIKNPLTSL